MSRFEIGDKVRVIPRNEAIDIYKSPKYIEHMEKYGGQVATIESRISTRGWYVLDICPNYKWHGKWLESTLDMDHYLFKDEDFDI